MVINDISYTLMNNLEHNELIDCYFVVPTISG